MTTSLDNEQKTAFEQYILAGDNEDKAMKAIDSLVQGSDIYYYVYFLHKFRKVGVDGLSAADRQRLTEWEKKGSANATQIKLRRMLLKLDSDKLTPNDEKEILDYLTKHYIAFNHNFKGRDQSKNLANAGEESKADLEAQVDKSDLMKYKPNLFKPQFERELAELAQFESKKQEYEETFKMMLDLRKTGFGRLRSRRFNGSGDENCYGEEDDSESDGLKDVDLNEEQKKKFEQFEEAMEKLASLLCQMRRKDPDFLHSYDFNKLPISVFKEPETYEDVFSNDISTLVNNSFFDVAIKVIEMGQDQRQSEQLASVVYRKMTIQQLDILSSKSEIIKKSPVFNLVYFRKQFCEELENENVDMLSNQEKMENLKRLYSLAKSKELEKDFLYKLAYEILHLGPKVGQFDKDLFNEFIKYSDRTSSTLYSDYKSNRSKLEKQEKQRGRCRFARDAYYQGNILSYNYNIYEKQIVEKYLEHFCEQNQGSLQEFAKMFHSTLLKDIEKRVKVYLAKNGIQGLEKEIDFNLYKSIADKVILALTEDNKETFMVEDSVSLKVELKNIQQLVVKIFEFNTETYYKKNLKPFDTSVNLDGLHATQEKVFEYDHSSNYKWVQQFDFPELKDKVGLYIFEFVGNGVRARAVVKKGFLTLISRSTIQGHQAYILDHHKKICKGDQTGVIFEEQYFQADPENGAIFIPYGKYEKSGKIIMLHNRFAQLSDFNRKTENITFSCSFSLLSESLLVGQSAQIVVKPSLFLNDRKTSLKQIRNSKIELQTINYIDNLPVTRNFNNITFSDDEEQIVSFLVPPNLQKVKVSINAEVLNATDKEIKKFNKSTEFKLMTQESTISTVDAYLQKKDGKYVVYVLGKNGEPQAQKQISTTFVPNSYLRNQLLSRRSEQVTENLVTDGEGKLTLGSLQDIQSVKVESSELDLAVKWNLPDYHTNSYVKCNVPDRLELLKGDSLELPIILREGEQQLQRKWFSFTRSYNGETLENWFDRVTLYRDEDSLTGNHYFRVEGLEQGDYQLYYLNGNSERVLEIRVTQGDPWPENPAFIINSYGMQERVQSNRIMRMSKCAVDKQASGSHKLRLEVENCRSGVHLTVQATTFLSDDYKGLYNKIVQNQAPNFSQSNYTFAQWKNMFFSNLNMGDELRYVNDRKKLESQLGNSLDRPSLLMNRMVNGSTEMDVQALGAGDAMLQQMEDMPMMKQAIGGAEARMMMKERDYYGRGGGGGGGGAPLMRSNPRATRSGGDITEFQNFLKANPFQKFNIKPKQYLKDTGKAVFEFEANFDTLQHLHLVVSDKESVVLKSLELNSDVISKRDLRLKKVLDDSKGLTERRETIKMSPNKINDFVAEHLIEDIRSSETMIIDNLNKVKEILSELSKVKGRSGSNIFTDFSFLTQWVLGKLSKDDKDRYFSGFSCHELHLFLKKHDPEYFAQVVQPFIMSKMEKSFMDWYLLGDDEEVCKFGSYDVFDHKLNAVEKCLVIDTLAKTGQTERATTLADLQQMEAKTRSNKDVNQQNLMFDLVLNLNKLDENKPNIASIAQDKSKGQASNDIMLESAGFSAAGASRGGGGRLMARRRAAPQNRNMKMQRRTSDAHMNCSDSDDYDECEEDFSAFGNQINNLKVNQKLNMEMFEKVGETMEYRETHYYKEKGSTFQNLIRVNKFWADLATHFSQAPAARGPFLTPSFVECCESERDTFLVACFLDIGFKQAQDHGFVANEARGVTVKAASNLLLYKKEIVETQVELKNDLMVIHRYTQDNGRADEEDSGIPGEFLTNTLITCEVVITNVSPKVQNFTLLYQIPQGSMPMLKTKEVKSNYMSLSPYSTQRTSFQFYFPTTGQYPHFPSNLSINSKVQAKGGANILNVVQKRTITQITSFDDLLQAGTKDDILKFLKEKDLLNNEQNFRFNEIYFLMKNKDFFTKTIEILRSRGIYEKAIWGYAFYHKDNRELMREAIHLNQVGTTANLFSTLGYHFNSKLITVNESSTKQNNIHFEYHPMVNARVHAVGGKNNNNILNKNFRETYNRFLIALMQQGGIKSVADKLRLVYYLQLQDRIELAIEIFESVEPIQAGSPLKVQYDYLVAYFDFFKGTEQNYEKARAVVAKYENYPHVQWKMMFLQIQDQLQEIDGEFDGEDEEMIDAADGSLDAVKIAAQRQKNQKLAKKRSPELGEIELSDNGELQIESVNIKEVTVKYYLIDAEILFSRSPFLSDETESFSYVMPYCQQVAKLVPNDASESQLNQFVTNKVPLPQKLQTNNFNLVIEIAGPGQPKFKTFFKNQLKVNIIASFGELKVVHQQTSKALQQVYVKVFYQSKRGGGQKFFRDGYTDIRGKFEYAQAVGDKVKDVENFAILVSSNEFGSKILQCKPPKMETEDVPKAQQVIGLSNMENRKMNRLQNRAIYTKSKKSKF